RRDCMGTHGAADGGASRAYDLDRLRVRTKPFRHQRLQAIHAAPCSVNVKWIKLVERHAVRDKRDIKLRRHSALKVERSPSRVSLAIPNSRPVRRILTRRELVSVVDNIQRIYR